MSRDRNSNSKLADLSERGDEERELKKTGYCILAVAAGVLLIGGLWAYEHYQMKKRQNAHAGQYSAPAERKYSEDER
jgi:hypothetical protein